MLRLSLSLPLLLLLGVLADAACSPSVNVELTNDDGVQSVKAFFDVEVSTSTAWGVLTDYDGIARWTTSMSSSRVVERYEDHILVEQEAVAKALFFKKRVRVLLHVVEEPSSKIFFKDVAGDDFVFYYGLWRLESDDGACVSVEYCLRYVPKFSAPFGAAFAKRNVKRMLQEVKDEMLRRQMALTQKEP